MNAKRNILFVVMDQLRADVLWGDLGAAVDLPNLRGFAQHATSFHRHYSVTSPCGPSRASMLTGQYAMNHRSTRNGTPLPHDTPNLATEMRKAGYLPLLYGYTDVASDPRQYHPNDPQLNTYEQVLTGFVEACEMRLEESWPWRAHLAAKGYDTPPYPNIFRPAGPEIDDPALYRAEDSDTAFLTDRLLSDLRVRPPGWFAHLTWIRPHPPLVAPAPYNRLVPRDSVPAPEPASDAHPFVQVQRAFRPAARNVEGFPDLPEDDATIATLRALYLGLAAEVDAHFGRIIDFLHATDQWEDTVIVVTSDHGEMLGDQGLWGKMTYHDAAFHTPLMVRDPSMTAGHGRVVTAPTESVDVTPTLLDLVGLDAPDDMDGCSLRPFLEGGTPATWRDYSFSELDFGNPLSDGGPQAALKLTPEQANLAVLRAPEGCYVHFNGGLDPIVIPGATAMQKDLPGLERDLARRMLDHRMTHAQGRFARTLVTSDGVQRGTRT